jgi:hypothetical protein
MSALFNQTLADSWTTLQAQPAVVPTAAVLVAALALYPVIFGNRKDSDIHELGGLSILTAWPFFKRRSDFLKANFVKTGQKLFSFKVLHVGHPMTCLLLERKISHWFAAHGRCDEGRGSTQGFLRR